MQLKRPSRLLSPTAFAGSLLLVGCAGGVQSETSLPAAFASRSLPPVRALGSPEAALILGTPMAPSFRVISDGRALMSDSYNRRLAMIDPTMTTITTIFDAQTPPPLTYAAGRVALIAGRGDTTLMFDNNTRGYRVLDANGKAVRRLGIVDANLLRGLSYPGETPAALDAEGRLVYVQPRNALDRPMSGFQPQPDSFMVTRIRLDRQGWDSLTAVKMGGTTIVVDTTVRPPVATMTMPVISSGDAWTMTPSGTIAIVRSKDFHVEWIESNGTRRRSPPVPWTWHRYTKLEKDSIMRGRTATGANVVTRVADANGNPPSSASALAQINRGFITRVDTVPDVAPAFATMSALSDNAGNIWVRLGARVYGPDVAAPSVYGVLDSSGQMIDRLSFPERSQVVGFGAIGTVYAVRPTMTRDGYALERYSYRKP